MKMIITPFESHNIACFSEMHRNDFSLHEKLHNIKRRGRDGHVGS